MISIIIPCFNCENTINRCLDSILKQTYEDFEVLAIDDGSSDSTYKLLKEYENKDSRIKAITKENGGPSSARNLGLSIANGEYIGFVDSDDYISENMYELLLKNIMENDAQIAICNYFAVEPNGNMYSVKHVLKPNYCCSEDIINGIIRQYYDGKTDCLPGLWNKLYDRNFLTSFNLFFDESLYRAEDWWFNLKLYEQADKIVTLQDSLYYYWQGNDNSIMKKMNANYYYEWKKARLYLDEKNKLYKFNYDKNVYYKQLILNIHSLILFLTKNKIETNFIFEDNFYLNIIKYDKKTNLIVKFCNKCIKINKIIAKLIYKLLTLIYY